MNDIKLLKPVYFSLEKRGLKLFSLRHSGAKIILFFNKIKKTHIFFKNFVLLVYECNLFVVIS